MKKIILTLTTLVALFCGVNASALPLPYTDYVDVDKVRDTLSSSNPILSGVWNISKSVNENHSLDVLGFNNTLETVTNAAVMFVFYEQKQDGGYNVDKAIFNLGGFNLGSAPDSVEIMFDSVYFGSVYADILFDIQEDGELEWEVQLSDTAYSISLWTATLGVETEPKEVPDSGTALSLLSVALIGIVFARRCIAN